MSLDPLFGGGLEDVDCDFQRRLIGNAADRASRFASILNELIDMREDNQAQAMREALAGEMSKINAGFQGLAKALNAIPGKMAAKHFKDAGDRSDEHRRYQRQQEDAEADAAATG